MTGRRLVAVVVLAAMATLAAAPGTTGAAGRPREARPLATIERLTVTPVVSDRSAPVRIRWTLGRRAVVAFDLVRIRPDGSVTRIRWIVRNRVRSAGPRLAGFGPRAADGVYAVRLAARPTDRLRQRRVARRVVTFVLDRTPPTVRVAPLAPLDPLTPGSAAISVPVADNLPGSVAAAALITGPGVAVPLGVRTVALDRSGQAIARFRWDGRLASGAPVAPGLYDVAVVAVDAAGNERRASAPIRVVAPSGTALPGATP